MGGLSKTSYSCYTLIEDLEFKRYVYSVSLQGYHFTLFEIDSQRANNWASNEELNER